MDEWLLRARQLYKYNEWHEEMGSTKSGRAWRSYLHPGMKWMHVYWRNEKGHLEFAQCAPEERNSMIGE